MFNKKLKHIIKTLEACLVLQYDVNEEFIARRDEVMGRGKHIIKRTFPDHLLDKALPELIEWMLEAFIHEEYIPYKQVASDEDRGAESAVIKIMEVRDKLDANRTGTED